MRKYSSSRCNSGFSVYGPDFVVETWERLRLWGNNVLFLPHETTAKKLFPDMLLFVIAAVVSTELRKISDWTICITELSICRLLSCHIFENCEERSRSFLLLMKEYSWWILH